MLPKDGPLDPAREEKEEDEVGVARTATHGPAHLGPRTPPRLCLAPRKGFNHPLWDLIPTAATRGAEAGAGEVGVGKATSLRTHDLSRVQ